MRPVKRLTAATEHVAETQDLRSSITLRQRGELGRLATSFNAMLHALDQSRAQQRQLVADAGHELRTPLTSLRTNIEVLATQPGMLEVERERLMADVISELTELSALVGAVVELAQEDASPDGEFLEIHLDELVTEAVDRARRHAPELTIRLITLEPTLVRGQEYPIERALTNILDNACKWSPPGGSVEVTLANSEVTGRDHGPGIDPVDLPHVFDRFYRAPAARPLPGSGLGLSIVRRVMDLHDGSVSIESTQGDGTLVRLAFPIIHSDP
jgi:two-component system sensor histidine kinase MprB